MFKQRYDFVISIILRLFNLILTISVKSLSLEAQRSFEVHFITRYKGFLVRILFTIVRYTILAIFVLPIALFKPNLVKPISQVNLPLYCLRVSLSLIVLYLTYTGYTVLGRSGFTLAIALGASEVIYSPIISTVRGLEKERKSLFLCVFIVLCGVLLLLVDKLVQSSIGLVSIKSFKSEIVFGAIIILLANLLCTCNHHVEKQISADGSMTVSFYSIILMNALLFIIVLGCWALGLSFNFSLLYTCDRSIKLVFGLMALLSFNFLFVGAWIARKLDTDVMVVISNLSPPIAMLYQKLVFGHNPTFLAITGAAYLTLGAILMAYRQQVKYHKDDALFLRFKQRIQIIALIVIISVALILFLKFSGHSDVVSRIFLRFCGHFSLR